jgi:chromosome partitioning protein
MVFVDLEGTASRLVSRAISRADLVIIPMQPSPLDSDQAIRALALIQEEEEVLRRPIRKAIILTRTSPAIPTRHERAITLGLRDANIRVFKNHLHGRQAFQAIFAEGLTLNEMSTDHVNGLDQAKNNALAIAAELIDILSEKE